MKFIRVKQKSKEWLEWRRTKITASDAGIILGISPFKTIEQLYNEKIKGFEQISNPYMLRGIELEPIALREFEKETGLIMFPVVGVHDEIDWMAASFDGMTIEEDVICEIKCPGKKDHQTALDGNIPSKYIAQLQHQIFVAGLDFSFYYSFDGYKGKIIEVKRDQEFIEKMLEKEKEFWNCLQTLTPPITITKHEREKYETIAVVSG